RFGLTYRRCLRLQEQGEVLCGEEQLTGRSGVPFAARFHLHPSIQAALIRDGEEVLLRARSGMGWRFKVSGANIIIEESIYAGEGEHPRPSLQIVLTGQTVSPATTVVWEMRREKM
ncbi:MAG: heparinase II/III-family protein, partial [Alphaproteobacteria bacterium]|nr:heparinase II/III-family protein [Alphaproteobacteria bacterium]